MIQNGEVHVRNRAQHTSEHGQKWFYSNIRSHYYVIKYILRSSILISRYQHIKYSNGDFDLYCYVLQKQTVLSASFSSKQLLPLTLVRHYCIMYTCICHVSRPTLIPSLSSYQNIDTFECLHIMRSDLSNIAETNNIPVSYTRYTSQDKMFIYPTIWQSCFILYYLKNVFQNVFNLEDKYILFFSPLLDFIIPKVNKYLLISNI